MTRKTGYYIKHNNLSQLRKGRKVLDCLKSTVCRTIYLTSGLAIHIYRPRTRKIGALRCYRMKSGEICFGRLVKKCLSWLNLEK